MDGGAWWAAVHGVVKSRTRLSDFTFIFHFHALEKEMATHSTVFLPGESQGWGSPVGYSPRGHKESGTTERLTQHISLPLSNSLCVYFCFVYIFICIQFKIPYTGGTQYLSFPV